MGSMWGCLPHLHGVFCALKQRSLRSAHHLPACANSALGAARPRPHPTHRMTLLPAAQSVAGKGEAFISGLVPEAEDVAAYLAPLNWSLSRCAGIPSQELTCT